MFSDCVARSAAGRFRLATSRTGRGLACNAAAWLHRRTVSCYALPVLGMKTFLLVPALLAGAQPLLAQNPSPAAPDLPRTDFGAPGDDFSRAGHGAAVFAVGFFGHARGGLSSDHSSRRSRFERLYGHGRCAFAQTGLSRSARRFQSPRRSHRARRAKSARFHDEESERGFSARFAKSRRRKARASLPI